MRLVLDIIFIILICAAVSGLSAFILAKIICRVYELKHRKNHPSAWKH
jgi:hypothetical protein